MQYRLGIDVGTNSLGWAMLELDEQLRPKGLIDLGVRIFSDARNPKDKSSNAAQRRGPRAMRRNRDRGVQRQKRLLNALVRSGLMPENKAARKELEHKDPWILRAQALDEKLDCPDIGRALFHLAQRRG